MVRKKRSVNELNGCQVPSKPRRSRSTKSKPCNTKLDGETMCAIDLLATVAQELLQEKNSISSSLTAGQAAPSVETDATKIEHMDKVEQFKQKTCGQGSCVESSLFLHEHVPNKSDDNILMKHSLNAEGVSNQYTSGNFCGKKADEPGKIVFKCLPGTVGNSFVSSAVPDHGIFKDEALSINASGCPNPEADNIVEDARMEDQGNGSIVHPLASNSCFSEEKITVDDRPPTLASSDRCVKVPFSGDHAPRNNSNANFHSGSKVVSRDDDEKSFGCTDSSTKSKEFHKSPNVTHSRIRKFMASRFYKVPPKVLKKGELFNVDHVIKSLDRGRKLFSTRQRIKRLSSYKRKKLSDRSFSLKYERSNCSGGPTNIGGKSFGEETPVYNAKRLGVKSASSPLVAERSSYGSVKLRIQSVNIPELFVEIPETATVGMLKRTVLEALTSILARGIRVGVLLQGKKVKDDDITLFQSGISFEKKLDSLGFALEPGHTQISFPPVCKEDTHCSNGVDFHVVARQAVMHPFNNVASHVSMEQSLPNVCQFGQSAYAFVPSSSIRAFDNVLQRPQALVAIPEMNLETLAVTPFYTKYRRPELSQRRTRRPFSVTEVEALVQAVENLGTGRWRDVKIRAFEDADHRTYVDLKDKWKTLVHTARISPQQRRGEPVPQVLLDRVLAAHSYWSQLQATQQGSEGNEQGEACMPLDPQ